MTMTFVPREENLARPAIRFHTRLNGLVLGVVSGLAYSLSAWGVDAITLGNASVDYFWVKLAIGSVFCLVIGGAAGWLTASSERGAAGMIIWALAGVAFAWAAGHLPFDGLSTVLRFAEPRLTGITPYPFVESARVRTLFMAFVVGGLSALAGTLELSLLDQAKDAHSGLGRALSLGLTIPFFALAGFASDGLINRPLRDPLVAVDQVFRWAIEARSTPVSPALARQRHLGAVQGIEDLIERPYRISMGAYDAASLFSFSVEVAFDGTWVRCSVLGSSPGYCREIDSFYQGAITCLLGGGQECEVNVADEARPWVGQSGGRGVSPASIHVLDHFGAVVFVEVTWSDGGHDVCVFKGAQQITLVRCLLQDGT
jgi:hypothetical protein